MSLCAVKDCNKPAKAVGMCYGHYYRQKRGSKSIGPIRHLDKPGTDLKERIERKSVPEPNTGCWLWTSSFQLTGYGSITVAGRSRLVHRVSYEAHKGPIPEGLQLDHLCRERSCVNPDHLEPVTLGENIRRGVSHNGSKTHCPKGHPYSGDNLAFKPNGHRFCRQCSRDKARAFYYKRKAALIENQTNSG